MEPGAPRASLSVACRQALGGGPSRRPPRLVIVSTALISVLIANDAQARPRLPRVVGAMLGAAVGMGGMMALHHRRHAHARHRGEATRQATAPAPTPANSEPAAPP